MFSIGQFSTITKITVKALRHYHELGLLLPDYIDDETGYRYYKQDAIERARLIGLLKEIEFPLSEIKTMLEEFEADEELLEFLERKRSHIAQRLAHYRQIDQQLEGYINVIKTASQQSKFHEDITSKKIEAVLFAGHRMKGVYGDIAAAFQMVGRKAGMKIASKGMGLFYDGEYKAEEADFEGGFAVKKPVKGDGIHCRELDGGTYLSLVHHGPYSTIHNSYEKLLTFMNGEKMTMAVPTREIYLKGPGMFLKGNPEKYITEILIGLA